MIDTTPGTANPRVTLCSTVSEASGEDPAGSAWALRRIVLIELPLPWPYNVLEARHAPAGLTEALYEIYDVHGLDWGMIGFASDSAWTVTGMRRVISLEQRAGLAATYHRVEYLVPPDEVASHLRALAFAPDDTQLAARRLPDDQATRDYFVCTHGAIDACCATFGYPVYQLMRAMADGTASPTRVWRCTHFGGHRFAATALEAPAGRYWGHLKADMLSSLVHRSTPARELRRHYRGWAAVPEPLWQIAEAELLAAAGWGWADATITGITGEASGEEGGTLKVAFSHPAVSGEVDVEIAPNGSLQTMDQSKDGELRDAPQYTTRIVAQRPTGIVAAIGDGRARA